MAYDGTIPALGNLISNDIPAMQENFSLLESTQVVDEGSTADGDYIRYENGWQICVYDDLTISYNQSDRLQGSWSLPAGFNEVPNSFGIVKTLGDLSGKTNLILNIAGSSTSSILDIMYIQTSGDGFVSGNTATLYVSAIGKWK